MDGDGVENSTAIVRVGVEGEAGTLRFDVVGMDDCVTQTLLLPPDDAYYYTRELVRVASLKSEHAARFAAHPSQAHGIILL